MIIVLTACQFRNFFDHFPTRRTRRALRSKKAGLTFVRVCAELERYWHGTSVNKMQNTLELAVEEDDDDEEGDEEGTGMQRLICVPVVKRGLVK